MHVSQGLGTGGMMDRFSHRAKWLALISLEPPSKQHPVPPHLQDQLLSTLFLLEPPEGLGFCLAHGHPVALNPEHYTVSTVGTVTTTQPELLMGTQSRGSRGRRDLLRPGFGISYTLCLSLGAMDTGAPSLAT